MKKINILLLLGFACSLYTMEDLDESDILMNLETVNTKAHEYLLPHVPSQNNITIASMIKSASQFSEINAQISDTDMSNKKRKKKKVYQEYNCSLCIPDKQFFGSNFKTAFRRHLYDKHKLFTYSCYAPKCEMIFSRKENMIFHMEKNHVPFECHKCSFSVSDDYRTFANHYSSKHENCLYKCKFNECTQEFSAEYDLFEHVAKTHYEIQLHKDCDVIEKEVKKRKYKTKNKPFFTCSYCDCTYKQFSSFRNHADRVHHVKEYFSCFCPGCSEKFCYKSDMNTHVEQHTNFCCELCSAQPKGLDAYKKHYSKFHKNCLYGCHFCECTFRDTRMLFMHEFESHLNNIQTSSE